jgi:rRNA-processing protein FCF1
VLLDLALKAASALGKEFDIEMVFKNLEKNRYISDGDKNTIVITNDTNLNKEIKNKKIIKY